MGKKEKTEQKRPDDTPKPEHNFVETLAELLERLSNKKKEKQND
jgi:hypothetical protein